MKIHIARLGHRLTIDAPVDTFTRLAARDKVGKHHVTHSPEHADVVLFPQCHMLPHDWRLNRIRRHPVTEAFRDKIMVYDERDRPWCAFPGVYVSMPARYFKEEHQRAWAYFPVPETRVTDAPDILFSFIGSNSASCRRSLFTLSHPDAIVAEAHGFTFYDPTSPQFGAQRARFQAVMARSRFVLCPRGRGTSSIRLYETLAAGRVPVIIPDDWVPPVGPAWESFSVRWPEHETVGLIDMLSDLDRDWQAMSLRARAAYAEYFSPDVAFHNVAELCDAIRIAPSSATVPDRGIRDRAYAAAGIDVMRWRASSAVRRAGKRSWRRLRGLSASRSTYDQSTAPRDADSP